MAVILWTRSNHPETQDALAFLKQNRYGADQARDLAQQPPAAVELEALRKGFGGELWPLVDARHPRYGEWLPRGAEDVSHEELAALLLAHPDLLKAPILLTPKGALAGFREQKWRAFLDIGKGRN
jgi:arsenate reductase-like glutaredoxin family protein